MAIDMNTFIAGMAAWMVLCTLLSYVIASRKGMKPLLPTLAGLATSIVPIVGLIYLFVLGFREAPGKG